MIESAAEILASLAAAGFPEREVFVKEGRTRRVTLTSGSVSSHVAEEDGWAVRAGTERAALFFAASGEPAVTAWPDPDGRPIALPPPVEGSDWRPPPELEAPLLIEREAHGLLQTIADTVASELPTARIVEGVLEDGASTAWIVNGHGIERQVRQRLAVLRVRAVTEGGHLRELLLAARAARQFRAERIGRELVSRLQLVAEGESLDRDRGEILIAPALATRLLEALQPLWFGVEARRRAKVLCDRGGRLAAPLLHVAESLRRHDGPLQQGWDGEGLPTQESSIVEEGHFRAPVVGRLDADPPRLPAAACCRRPSWRDRPRWGISQLFIRPDPRVRAAELLEGIGRGYYLLDDGRPVRLDLAEDRFAVPVAGWALASGRASRPVSGVLLTGRVSKLLRGVQAVAGDLEFFPLGAVFGSPSLLVVGLELVRDPEARDA